MPEIQDFWSTRIVERSGPQSVVYDLRSTHQTTITLPAKSTWTSGLHWHETHTEYLQVIKGSIKVTLDGRTTIIHAPAPESKSGENDGSATIKAPPPIVRVDVGVRHEWSRADGGDDVEGGEVVVIERTAPDDGAKTGFFWCVNGVILRGVEEIKAGRGSWAEWMMWFQLLEVFLLFDNYPVTAGGLTSSIGRGVPMLERSMEWIVTHLLLWLGWTVCRVGGFGVHRRAYTPPSERRKVK